MAEWEGSTSARTIATGATIYIERKRISSLPTPGMSLSVSHPGGAISAARIVSASLEAIAFDIDGTRWLTAPASEAAPTAVADGKIIEAWIVT